MQPGRRRKLDLTPSPEGSLLGLAKNEAQLFALFGLANIVIAKRRLLDIQARGAS
jgi:hypothetical protein